MLQGSLTGTSVALLHAHCSKILTLPLCTGIDFNVATVQHGQSQAGGTATRNEAMAIPIPLTYHCRPRYRP